MTEIDRVLGVKSGVFDKMQMYNHPQKLTIAELSKKHKLLLVFLRYFECTFCQAMVGKVAANYKSLLQMNTIPVLIHQETVENGDKYFSEMKFFEQYQPIVSNLWRVSNAALDDVQLYEEFKLGQQSLADAPLKVVKRQNFLVNQGFNSSRVIAKENRKYSFQMPGVFLVENCKVLHEFQYTSVADNPNLFKLVVDPQRVGVATDAFCDLTCDIENSVCFASVKPTQHTEKLPDSELQDNSRDSTDSLDLISPLNVLKQLALADPYKDLSEYVKSKSGRRTPRSWFSPSYANEKLVLPSDDFKNSIQLQQVLDHQDALRYFKVFCAKECSLENILFYEAVRMYKVAVEENSSALQFAEQNIHTFFRPGSVNELNISKSIITRVKDKVQQDGPGVTLFQEAIVEVLSDHLNDTFARFKQSDDFSFVTLILHEPDTIDL